MRKIVVLIVTLLTLAMTGSAVAQSLAAGAAPVFPKIVPLPNGFQPEGIVVGNGTDLYAGSLATGAIYRANLRTGTGEIVVPPQSGRIAVGLAFDPRTSFLFVAGGPLGAAYVYNTQTGESEASYQLTGLASFVNDVVVTEDAAYFTDSFQPVFYRAPLSDEGALPDPSAVQAIPLTGDFVFVPGAFNANGIEATPDGRYLVIVNSANGELYRVDPATGQATLIDLGGESVPAGDGLLLAGQTLYVVQNSFNQIAVVQLEPDLTSGQVVERITDPAFRVPTTIAKFGNALYVVNARFDTPPTPDTEYEVVKVSGQ